MTNYVGCHNERRGADRRQQRRRLHPQSRRALRGHPRRLVADDLPGREAQRRHGAGLGLGHAGQPAEHGHGGSTRRSNSRVPGRGHRPATWPRTPDNAARPGRRSSSADSAAGIPAAPTSLFGDGSVRFLKNSIGCGIPGCWPTAPTARSSTPPRIDSQERRDESRWTPGFHADRAAGGDGDHRVLIALLAAGGAGGAARRRGGRSAATT